MDELWYAFVISMLSKHHRETDHSTRNTGYSRKLFINPEAITKYICAICKNVLRDPVQIPALSDPKRACENCYKDNIRWVSICDYALSRHLYLFSNDVITLSVVIVKIFILMKVFIENLADRGIKTFLKN